MSAFYREFPLTIIIFHLSIRRGIICSQLVIVVPTNRVANPQQQQFPIKLLPPQHSSSPMKPPSPKTSSFPCINSRCMDHHLSNNYLHLHHSQMSCIGLHERNSDNHFIGINNSHCSNSFQSYKWSSPLSDHSIRSYKWSSPHM